MGDAGDSRDEEPEVPPEDAWSNGSKQEVVILLVGNEIERISRMANALTNDEGGGGWSEVKTTQAGVQIRIRASGAPRVVVSTTPLRYSDDNVSPTAVASQWVSHNSLRRIIFGKPVIVVCAIAWSILEFGCVGSVFELKKCWVDVLKILFVDKRSGIFFHLERPEQRFDEMRRRKMEENMSWCIERHGFEPTNIVYSSDGDEMPLKKYLIQPGMPNGVRPAAEDRPHRPRGCLEMFPCCRKHRPIAPPGSVTPHQQLMTPALQVSPFLKDMTTGLNPDAIWAPERVVLFGVSGSGKSTVAQMLTRGRLDHDSKTFGYDSGIRGHTRCIETGEGRGWYVVDTPGFGESQTDTAATISTERLSRLLTQFFKLTEGTFAHYLYITKAGRVDEQDELFWRSFKEFFNFGTGVNIAPHVSVVVTGDTEENWMERNLSVLESRFDGCTSFLRADFPPVDQKETDKDFIEESEGVQRKSLQRLEEDLAKLRRCNRAFRIGKKSKMTYIIDRKQSQSDIGVEPSIFKRSFSQVSEDFHAIAQWINTAKNMLVTLVDSTDLESDGRKKGSTELQN